MKASTTTRALLLLFAILAVSVPSAVAGKVKGLKGASNNEDGFTQHTRALKKDKKTKKAKGPSSRSCKSSAKPNEVTFECKSRSGDVSSSDSSDKKSKKSSGSTDSSSVDDASSLEAETRGIQVTPNEEIKDKIKYRVKTSKDGIRMKIEYEQEVETEDTTTETETEFELVFDRVVEYVKSTEGGELSEAYDWELDEIVQTIPLTRWEAIPGIMTDAQDVVSYFTATTGLPPQLATSISPPGTIQFNYTISQADVGEQITANSMKIDVRILDFPWTRDDSYVALLSTVESKKTVYMEYDNEATVGGGKTKETEDVIISFNEETEGLGIQAFGEYTWAFTADATGNSNNNNTFSNQLEQPVVASRQAGGNAQNETTDDDEVENSNGPEPSEVFVVTEETSTIEVIATSPENQGTDNFQSIAYSFVGDGAHSATEIYWDPKAGISYEEPISAAGRQQMPLIGLVGSAIVALFYLVC